MSAKTKIMSAKTKNPWTIMLLIAAVGLCLIGVSIVRAQEENAPRRLWDGAFLKKRAEAKTQAPASKKPAYKRVKTNKPATLNNASQNSHAQNTATQNKPDTAAQNKPAEEAEGEVIGLTIWRLRPSRSADDREARLLIEEGSSKEVEWTPERVEVDTIFASGERVRLGVESPRDGYLYVIDREQYTDGSVSDPYLIFPSLNNRDGANSVAAGKLIELPGRSSVFRLDPMRPDYAGEVLTIVVTSEPLKDLKPGTGPVKLNAEMVSKWESQWEGAFERFELVGGAGKPYTKAEKEAGQDGSRSLTQNDAMPQTLYQVDVKSGAPLLVKLPLRIGK
jgi:hypothetical protein